VFGQQKVCAIKSALRAAWPSLTTFIAHAACFSQFEPLTRSLNKVVILLTFFLLKLLISPDVDSLTGEKVMSTQQAYNHGPSLQQFGQGVLEVLELFCNLAWQASSKRIQKKYTQYALTPSELRRKRIRHEDEVEIGTKISIYSLIEHVLDPLFIVDAMDPEEWKHSSRKAGRVLRDASYVKCCLGGISSYADLEFHIQILETTYSWEDNQYSAIDRLELYEEGEPIYLVSFLNSLLDSSSQAITLLSKNNMPFEIRSIWSMEGNRYVRVDREVLETGYYLYVSLLQTIESVKGNC
jgi:hypothetical protein